ncbi:MAG: HAMP domain-containing sensor histidine kinase, partial [Bacteroidota bacterium]
IYSRLDLYEKAVELDEENLALAKQDSAYVSQLYTYFGMIASAQDYGDYEKVKEIFDEANLLREQTGVSIAFGFLHYIMGLAQLDQNQVDAAVENFEKGIEISKAQKDESELFDCYLGLAMALRKKGEIEEPLRLATIVEETRTSFRPKLNKLLIDLYRTTNRNADLMVQLEERYVYQEKFESERKDVVKQLVAAQLKQQQQTYELREQKQQSELQYEHRLNNLLWGLVAVVSVFCALLVYLLNQSRRQRRTIQLQKKELEEKSINLERANHKKDEVLAVIGHDLRGPIGGIKAVVDMTVDGDISSEELVDMFPELQKNTTAMYEILNNLLHWANIQMKGSKIDHQQSINARQEFQRVKNFLATLIQQKQIRFENNIQPTVIANGNLDDFNIIIRNLLSNAIKFTPEGGSIKVHALDGEHGLTFQVQDSGAGIAKEKLSSIFNTGTTTYGTDGEKGTGLGLNLCKALVKKNGGEIWVESQEG